MQHLTSSSGRVLLSIRPGVEPKEILQLLNPGFQGKDRKYYALVDIPDLVDTAIENNRETMRLWGRLSFPIRLGNLFVWQIRPEGSLFWLRVSNVLQLEAYNGSVNLTDP